MAGAFTQSPVGAYGGASGSAQLAGGLGQGGGGAALDSAAAAATSTSSASLGSRISDFVEKNKRGLLIGLGATVVVVGSAGAYYYYTKPTASRKKGKGADGEDSPSIGGVADDSGASGKRKSKKKKSKKSTGPATSTQERSSSPTVEEGDSEGSAADGELFGLDAMHPCMHTSRPKLLTDLTLTILYIYPACRPVEAHFSTNSRFARRGELLAFLFKMDPVRCPSVRGADLTASFRASSTVETENDSSATENKRQQGILSQKLPGSYRYLYSGYCL